MNNTELLYAIQTLKDILSRNNVMPEYLIFVDANSVLYLSFLDDTITNILKNLSADESFAESAVGPNAFSLALKNKSISKVVGEEHTYTSLKKYISYAVPIIINNKVLGAVGLIVSNRKEELFQFGLAEKIIPTAVYATCRLLEARKNIDELYLLKQFINNINNSEGVILIDYNQNILQANSTSEQILGVKKYSLLGKNINNFFPKNIFSQNKRNHLLTLSKIKMPIKIKTIPLYSLDKRLLGWLLNFTLSPSTSAKSFQKKNFLSKKKPLLYEFDDIIGENREFKKLIKKAQLVARSPSSILITGESGTGKELFAQAIHQASQFSSGPFVALNCAAIPKDLIEAELFGYREGAFTGAKKGGYKGKFLQADGGTLFLDEIGDMPLEVQSKVLRAIQEKKVTPLGGNNSIPTNIRIISATNKNLEVMIKENTFRSDLYFRINVINLHLPPLRERKDDILLLAHYFLNIYAEKFKKPIREITGAASQCLQEYSWPGNIRELENAMEMVINLTNDIVDREHLPKRITKMVNINSEPHKNQTILSMEELEKKQLIKALKAYDGNISQAAKVLNIGRTTIYRKIKKYNIKRCVKVSEEIES